jgi:hypothetical protein
MRGIGSKELQLDYSEFNKDDFRHVDCIVDQFLPNNLEWGTSDDGDCLCDEYSDIDRALSKMLQSYIDFGMEDDEFTRAEAEDAVYRALLIAP